MSVIRRPCPKGWSRMLAAILHHPHPVPKDERTLILSTGRIKCHDASEFLISFDGLSPVAVDILTSSLLQCRGGITRPLGGHQGTRRVGYEC